MKISDIFNENPKKSFLCCIGLHTKPKSVSGMMPPMICTKCEKVLEPHLRTDIRFKINLILGGVIFIVIMLIIIIGLIKGFIAF
jgi:hypothetical protein